MAPITSSIDVDRPAAEVFAYATDPGHFAEWQKNVTGGHMDAGETGVGARCITRRRIGLAERDVTAEVTHRDAPHAWGVRGIDGPIRATVNLTVEPTHDGSKLTITIDFTGHGIGKLLVPLIVQRDATKEMPENLARLKRRLEQPAPATAN